MGNISSEDGTPTIRDPTKGIFAVPYLALNIPFKSYPSASSIIGTVVVQPRQPIQIYKIVVTLNGKLGWVGKNNLSNFDSPEIYTYNVDLSTLQTQENGIVTLIPGNNYTFPFTIDIPNTTDPTFWYPPKKNHALTRYNVKVEMISNFNTKWTEEKEIEISSSPMIYNFYPPNNCINDKKDDVIAWTFSKSVFNFNEKISFTLGIDNTKGKYNIISWKYKVYRKVRFYRNDQEVYSSGDIAINEMIKNNVIKIGDNKSWDETMAVYNGNNYWFGFDKELNQHLYGKELRENVFIMPSVISAKCWKCEYFLEIWTAYEGWNVFGLKYESKIKVSFIVAKIVPQVPNVRKVYFNKGLSDRRYLRGFGNQMWVNNPALMQMIYPAQNSQINPQMMMQSQWVPQGQGQVINSRPIQCGIGNQWNSNLGQEGQNYQDNYYEKPGGNAMNHGMSGRNVFHNNPMNFSINQNNLHQSNININNPMIPQQYQNTNEPEYPAFPWESEINNNNNNNNNVIHNQNNMNINYSIHSDNSNIGINPSEFHVQDPAPTMNFDLNNQVNLNNAPNYPIYPNNIPYNNNSNNNNNNPNNSKY